MNITRLLTTPATLRRISTTTENAEGTPVLTVINESVMVHIEQRGSGSRAATTENQDDHLDVTTGWRLFTASGVSIGPADEVVIGTETYGVDGQPWQVLNPRTGEVDHIEANLVTRRHQ
jgi:hypothetical protein